MSGSKSFPGRLILIVLCTLMLAACGEHKPATPDKAAEQRVLNFYSWAEYIDPEIVQQFEKENGLTVRFDTVDSEEMLETKLLTGHSDYDVVVTSANVLARQVAAGALRKLDFDALPNRRNLDPALMALIDPTDPRGEHAAPCFLLTTGIGMDVDKIRKRLPNADLEGWSLVLDHADKQQLGAAEKLLMSIRPYVRYINSEKQVADLADGDICATFGWAGDVSNARARAIAAGKPLNLKFSVPREGAILLVDLLAIPKDAPHVADAERFINFLLRADIGARNANFVAYSSPNLAAMPFIEVRLKNDPGLYPPAAIKAKLRAMPALDLETTRLETQIWRHFRTGS